MQIFKKKKLLLALSVAAVVPFMVACSLFGPKDLADDTEAQKSFLEEVETKFSEQESYKVEASGTMEGEEVEIAISVDGENYAVDMKGQGMEMSMKSIGEYSYVGFKEDWLKMKEESDDDVLTGSFTEMKDDLTEELVEFEDSEFEDGDIEYMGLEDLEGVKCYKFKIKNEEGEDAYVWFDATKKLPKKAESTENAEDEMVMTFSYDDITVEEPTDYEDLTDMSEEEKQEKLMELYTSMME